MNKYDIINAREKGKNMDNILDGIEDNMWGDIFDDDYYGWTPMLTYNELKIRFIEYLKMYGASYDKNNLKIIKDYFLSCLGIKSPNVLLAQIYSCVGAYSTVDDPYIGYLNKLKEFFNINCNILDVASGDYPAFGVQIAKEQLTLSNGTVTMYDPNLVLGRPLIKNMVLHKEKFTKETVISNFDVVTSILPCSVTDLLLDRLLEEDKEFFVALCNCHEHGQHGHQIRSHEEIISEVNSKIQKRGNGKLIVEHLEEHYRNKLPILIYKK